MCIFCDYLAKDCDIIFQNEHVFVIYDHFPVSKGHALIMTKRHVKTYFEINEKELIDLNEAINQMKAILDDLYSPDGYNIGMNCGVAAGQSVMHLHIHLIPRYTFDCKNPKGGVRGVIPGKQKY